MEEPLRRVFGKWMVHRRNKHRGYNVLDIYVQSMKYVYLEQDVILWQTHNAVIRR